MSGWVGDGYDKERMERAQAKRNRKILRKLGEMYDQIRFEGVPKFVYAYGKYYEGEDLDEWMKKKLKEQSADRSD